jgi:hypothetical protein
MVIIIKIYVCVCCSKTDFKKVHFVASVGPFPSLDWLDEAALGLHCSAVHVSGGHLCQMP